MHASGKKIKVQEETRRVFLVSVDVFPTQLLAMKEKYTNGEATDHRAVAVWGEEMQSALDWIAGVRSPTDMVVVCDGRSKAVLRKVDVFFNEKLGDPNKHVEAWIIYTAGGPHLVDDPRFPKRKVAFASANREMVSIALPERKTQFKAKPRSTFAMCGEKSTHDQTYSGVSVRSLGELPRLSEDDRRKLAGVSTAPVYSEKVLEALRGGGFPLYWSDWKPIDLWTVFSKMCRQLTCMICPRGLEAQPLARSNQASSMLGLA